MSNQKVPVLPSQASLQSKPYMKDFQFYKQRFAQKQKEIKDLLRKFAQMEDVLIAQQQEAQNLKNASRDIESGPKVPANSQQQIISRYNQLSDEIQLQIDELEEILKETGQIQLLQQSERSVQVRLKNQLTELTHEYNQIKKEIKKQLRAWQNCFGDSRGGSRSSLSNRRMKNLADQSQGIDKTLELSNSIMSCGSESAVMLEGQTGKLKNARNNLTRIEKSSIPGADKLISLIGKHQKKNTIIIALVISICLVCIMHSLGIIDMLRSVSNTVTPLVSGEQNGTKVGQHSANNLEENKIKPEVDANETLALEAEQLHHAQGGTQPL